jgi:hypothetical protein
VILTAALIAAVSGCGSTFQKQDGQFDWESFEKAVDIAKNSGLRTEIDLEIDRAGEAGIKSAGYLDTGIRAAIRLRHDGDGS